MQATQRNPNSLPTSPTFARHPSRLSDILGAHRPNPGESPIDYSKRLARTLSGRIHQGMSRLADDAAVCDATGSMPGVPALRLVGGPGDCECGGTGMLTNPTDDPPSAKACECEFRDGGEAVTGTLPLVSVGPSGIGGYAQTEIPEPVVPNEHGVMEVTLERINQAGCPHEAICVSCGFEAGNHIRKSLGFGPGNRCPTARELRSDALTDDLTSR